MNYKGKLVDDEGNVYYPELEYGYIEMRGWLSNGVSFNDIVESGESSAYIVDATTNKNDELPGYPVGAYKYGTLITINPGHYSNLRFGWSIVQFYVPYVPITHGLYVRNNAENWLKISGEAVTQVI